MSINTFTLTLQWAELITPTVRHLAFIKEDGMAFDFIPGQFITIHIDSAERQVRRSYSVASIPGKGNTIEIAASYVKGGIGSELLFGLQPGGNITASGPFGRLVLRDEPVKRLVLIATGTGVTPYRSMLPELEHRFLQQPDLQVVLFLGIQSRNDLLYGNDFVEFAQRHPTKFIFNSYYSRQFPSEPQFFERQGHVQDGFSELALNPAADIVYLCGNPNMIDESYAYMKAHGFEQQYVRREKYISSK